MPTDNSDDDVLVALADALRDFAAGCTPTEWARLVDTLDEHGLEVAGVNVPDEPPSGGVS